MDNTLDYELILATLRKPNNTDLILGLATVPALYTWKKVLEMGELIRCQFKSLRDLEKVKNSMLTAYFFLSDLSALLGSRTSLLLIYTHTNLH